MNSGGDLRNALNSTEVTGPFLFSVCSGELYPTIGAMARPKTEKILATDEHRLTQIRILFNLCSSVPHLWRNNFSWAHLALLAQFSIEFAQNLQADCAQSTILPPHDHRSNAPG